MTSLLVKEKILTSKKIALATVPNTKGLGKYQRLILEALKDSPMFTNELWKLCQRSGLARAVKTGRNPEDFTYSYPPFRFNVAKTLKALKERGLVKDCILQGTTFYNNPIKRHYWYLVSEPTTELDRLLTTANLIAQANGWVIQDWWHSAEKQHSPKRKRCASPLCHY